VNNGVDNGVFGFWAQASPILMAVLTSHVIVRSCGLCVISDSDVREGSPTLNERSAEGGSSKEHSSRVVEISVRELSTPVGPSHSMGPCHLNPGGNDLHYLLLCLHFLSPFFLFIIHYLVIIFSLQSLSSIIVFTYYLHFWF
jgi:hypothetical protein